MNRYRLVTKTLRDTRTATLAIAATCFAMAAFTAALYPAFADSFKDVELPGFYDSFSGGLDITTPEGFLNTEFFSWIPLLLITLAIIAGTGTLAGEENSGGMDLLLAQPVTRRSVVLQKALGASLAIVFAIVVSLPGIFLAALFVDFDVHWAKLIFATLNMAPLALVYLGISMWAAAALPTRGAAVVVAVGLAVVPFLLHTVLAAASIGEIFQKLTPFYWGEATEILKGNARWQPAVVFLALYVALVGLAVLSFERRDIDVGGWSPISWLRRRFVAEGRAEAPSEQREAEAR